MQLIKSFNPIFLILTCFLLTPYAFGDSNDDNARSAAKCNEGTRLSAEGKEDEAIECYLQALAINPNDPITLYDLGNSYCFHKNDFKSAKIQYQKAVELNPKYEKAWYGLGTAELRMRDYKSAEAALLRALALKPDDMDANYNLGDVYYKTGSLQNCQTRLQKAASLAKSKEDISTIQEYLSKVNRRISGHLQAGD